MPKKVIKGVDIIDYAAEGKSLAKVDGKTLFIPKTAPGDNVDVLIRRKRKDFLEGRALQFNKKSQLRVKPFCQHFDFCGGCQWQHVPYSEQLKFKEEQVIQQLNRIGGLELNSINPIIACENDRFYRNKMEYSFSNQKWLTPDELKDESIKKNDGLGFHISGRFDKVLNIEKCHLQDDYANIIRNKTSELAKKHKLIFYDLRKREGEIRSLVIRNNRQGKWMILIQFGIDLNQKLQKFLEEIKLELPELSSICYIINKKLNDSYLDLETHIFSGEEFLFETIEDYNFRIRPKSFFQTNPDQAEILYSKVRELCGSVEDKIVYDLYTGTGSIAIFLASNAKKVIGIESVDQAIEDAKWNAKHNHLNNAEFYCADMRKFLTMEFAEKVGKPDIIVCDPPRDGMHKDVVEVIMELEAKRIVYVSCKPSTQARDLAILKEKYSISQIQPVDMFPHTHHVESVVLLELK